ncbi:hypothetical protein COU19_02055 [Candidatus Kaiserbacteria bacterium CG10_big_fil_rev_8_21_14_0_10_56_12]|uniref:Uncharacterized protein n=1 Tax=Candidatus Kaiserbacteria bacterium CG10_big_fil_rev_8_21_14_0_10_56_12 TaxID=1974611 RepID=A0A2H0UBV5_9BACT|nr:MAG: hypothetical protein COU19_02055 [Candidatus Kaiserbacteria bacterium CG10_big_fil_rev_8_21_14_0_10_56_12]
MKAAKYPLSPEAERSVEEKLLAPLRLFGDRGDTALLEVELEEAPPEGRSSEPCRLVARLSIDGYVYHAEAVKPTPESAADRVRSQLEAEIRRARGRSRRLLRRGGVALKRMLRIGS